MPRQTFKPIYVLHGEDEFTRDEHRRRIVREVIGDDDPQLAVSSHDGKKKGGGAGADEEGASPAAAPAPADPLLAAVMDDLATLPLMASRRLVIVRDADLFISANRGAIEKYLEKPSPSASLLLMARSWPSNTNLFKIVARIGQAVECSAPGGAGVSRWIREAARKRGNPIDDHAAATLAELAGSDLAALDSEVEKLSLYAGQGAAITAEHARLLTASTAGAADFALKNALAVSDAKSALATLDKELARRGEEFRILGGIGAHVRQAIAGASLLQAGQDPCQALPPNVPPHVRGQFLELLKRRPLRKLQADARRVLSADLALKSGASPRGTMQDLVLALCA
jgi:DNA polymerase III subunit delta